MIAGVRHDDPLVPVHSDRGRAAELAQTTALTAEHVTVSGIITDLDAMIVDADGLNAFANEPHKLKHRRSQAPRILTPHPGEFSRVTEKDTKTIQIPNKGFIINYGKEDIQHHRT